MNLSYKQIMNGQLSRELSQVESKLKEAIAKDDAYEINRLNKIKDNLKRRLYG